MLHAGVLYRLVREQNGPKDSFYRQAFTDRADGNVTCCTGGHQVAQNVDLAKGPGHSENTSHQVVLAFKGAAPFDHGGLIEGREDKALNCTLLAQPACQPDHSVHGFAAVRVDFADFNLGGILIFLVQNRDSFAPVGL